MPENPEKFNQKLNCSAWLWYFEGLRRIKEAKNRCVYNLNTVDLKEKEGKK